jgi:hypothetical protein
MQFSPASYHFISLRFKNCSQHHVLKHTQSAYFEGSDSGVLRLGFLGFGLRQWSYILKNNKDYNVSETGSVSILR